jgi:hypothetical protein
VRDVYLTETVPEAELLLDEAIVACADDAIDEARSLGRTLARSRTEILNHHRAGASNGPTERLNLLVEKGQALRPRLPLVRHVPPPDPSPVWRRQLARERHHHGVPCLPRGCPGSDQSSANRTAVSVSAR